MELNANPGMQLSVDRIIAARDCGVSACNVLILNISRKMVLRSCPFKLVKVELN